MRWLDAPVAEGDEGEDEVTYVCRAQYHPGTGEFVPLNGKPPSPLPAPSPPPPLTHRPGRTD